MFHYDNFERLKPFRANSKDVVGETTAIPVDDNEENFKYFDV
jgi:hypothetical protein